MRMRMTAGNLLRAMMVFVGIVFSTEANSARIAVADEPRISDHRTVKNESGESVVAATGLSEIKVLSNDVRSLREEVRRLCDLIEKRSAVVSPNSGGSELSKTNDSSVPVPTQRDESELQNGFDRVLFFTATWCGPCQQMMPIVKKLKREGESIELIDIDQENKLLQQYRVESIPCCVLIKDGKEVARKVGKLDEKDLRAFVEPLPSGNIKQTPAAKEQLDPIIVRVYPVVDLVLTIPEYDDSIKVTRQPKATTTNWLKLIDKITTSIEPQIWNVNGGSSTIRVDADKHSLVIRAPRETHKSIHRLLFDIRAEADVQIVTEVQLFENLENDFWQNSGITIDLDPETKSAKLSAADTTRFAETFRNRAIFAPKITAFNGVIGEITNDPFRDGNSPSFRLMFRGTVLNNGAQIRFNAAFNPQSNPVNELVSPAFIVEKGESMLFDITDRIQRDRPDVPVSGRMFVLICPRVINQEYEEVIISR